MAKNTLANIMKKRLKLMSWGQSWKDAFSTPEVTGVWQIVGKSGNGKSSFTAQLAKELARVKMGKVVYNSLEEKFGQTFQNTMNRVGMAEVGSNFLPVVETLAELDARLSKPKSPKVVFIDSIQAWHEKRVDVLAFTKKWSRTKLIVFISQMEGKRVRGKTAEDIWYLADLKIWVEGFRAISHGRYNVGGIYTVWHEKAAIIWGAK